MPSLLDQSISRSFEANGRSHKSGTVLKSAFSPRPCSSPRWWSSSRAPQVRARPGWSRSGATSRLREPTR